MFTDMVGYTALIQADERLGVDKRDRYMSALESQHDAFGGTIVQRLGDGSMSMFPSSLDAVLAAVAIQQELAAQEVPVRIGVHVGEVVVEPERLTGVAVNIAARIESFAVPGGVMLSDSAYDQIKNRSDIGVVRLGRFRLKNVGRPFELYAVAADGIIVPDPAALEGKGERFASLPSNLPEPNTELVGRAADLASLVELAREHRVVTITGPGGVGKTRIVVELGRLLAPEFLDGVSFVALADITDPAQFLPALADALDVKEAEGRTLGDGVVALIGDKKALLLLDNLEQVVSAAPEVAGLSERCPELRIVTTSRTPLRIAAEREYALDALELSPAIALFVDRARSTRSSFELTAENEDAVAAVCRRLDGLPLALELAAARLRLLSPQALLERLDQALQVLTSGARDVPERQQTLRAAIDWSHSLLSEPEQRLFRRMAVFAGGCTFADVEAVCTDPGESVLDELESLVDKALVKPDGQGDRLRLLQTIGEYARERLDAADEARDVSLRHAHRYAELGREIRDGIEGTDQIGAVERGIAEESNLQAALDTLLEAAKDGDADACACLSETSRTSSAASSRSRAYSPIVCSSLSRSLWPSGFTSALSTSDSSSSTPFSPGFARPPRRPRTCNLLRRRPYDGTGAARAPRSEWLRVDRGAERLLPFGNVARAGVSTWSAWSSRSSSASGEGAAAGRRRARERAGDRPVAGRSPRRVLVLGSQLERASGRPRARRRARSPGGAQVASRAILPFGGDRSDLRLVVTIRSSGQRSLSRRPPGQPTRPARGCRAAGEPACRRSGRRRRRRGFALGLLHVQRVGESGGEGRRGP